MASTGGGWAQLRQQTRSLETQVHHPPSEPQVATYSPAHPQTETLFHTYSQYASMSNIPAKPTEEEQRTEAQLKETLDRVYAPRICFPLPQHHNPPSYQKLTPPSRPQREALLAQLSRLLDSDAHPSALKSSNLSRHREILSTHRHELTRLTSLITSARDRANLLSHVRADISSHYASNPEAEYMLDERGRIDNSHSMADSVLSQAYAVNENFGVQRETLSSINRRITGAVGLVPGINGLIGRIGAKKRRDGIILGTFIA
ncbi:protein transport protein gos1, partial [Cryomyces antarcticus]